jgi:hypothetical protein
LLIGSGPQVAQRELGGVVERLPGGVPERCVLVRDSGLVQCGHDVKHGLLGGLQHRVKTTEHGHGKDDIAILPTNIEVTKHVVSDAPDEADDSAVLRSVHLITPRRRPGQGSGGVVDPPT